MQRIFHYKSKKKKNNPQNMKRFANQNSKRIRKLGHSYMIIYTSIFMSSENLNFQGMGMRITEGHPILTPTGVHESVCISIL